MQFDFRIDREPSADDSVETWQARYARPGGWSRFRLTVRRDHSACALNSTRLETRLVGRTMSRKLDPISEASDGDATGPFRSTPQGNWTVLEVALPEKNASFLLGLAGQNGRGAIAVHRSGCAEAVLQVLRDVLGSDVLSLHESGPARTGDPAADSRETESAKAEPSDWLLELDEFFEVIN